jgi:hypothetical protein
VEEEEGFICYQNSRGDCEQTHMRRENHAGKTREDLEFNVFLLRTYIDKIDQSKLHLDLPRELICCGEAEERQWQWQSSALPLYSCAPPGAEAGSDCTRRPGDGSPAACGC